MVISAEPPPPPPPDPVAADAAAVEAVAAVATSNARQTAAFSSFLSLKTWGSHRALRYAHVNRAGDATAGRSAGKLAVVEEKAALSYLREVEAGRSDAADADADHVAAAAAEEAAPVLPPWKLRNRRRPKPKVATPSASMSPPPPHERRPSRACAEALDRAWFSVTLMSEEIEEDI